MKVTTTLATLSAVVALCSQASAAVVSLSVELDLNDSTYVQQQDGQVGVLWRAPIAPVSVTSVGDSIVTEVTFIDKGKLQLVNRSDPAQPNLEIERLQYEFVGPIDVTTATRTTSSFEIRRSGQFLVSNPTPPFSTAFTCGNRIRRLHRG